MPTLTDKALRLAFAAHEGQKRHEGVPYITHPVAVALMLAQNGFGEEVVAAALCHDVLEDTAVAEDAMRQELGDTVTGIVKAVSYDRSLPWKGQRERYIESVREAGESAMAVSLADKIHNAQSLLALHAAEGPAMWGKFSATKEQKLWFEEAMLAMLKEAWQHPLVGEYEGLVAKLKALD
jgi:(p)ppGpp synthase/HD superfamily hydrolase